MNIAVFASGEGTDLQAIIDGCNNKKIAGKVTLVISNNKEANALNRAAREEIPSYYISVKEFVDEKNFEDKLLELLKEYKTDIIFLAGYLKKMPERIIREYSDKIYNIHPSLLPKFGGKGMYGINVHKAVIESNEKETGVTIHKVNEDYDKGEIVGQTKVPVYEDDTPEILSKRVLNREHEFLIEILSKIVQK